MAWCRARGRCLAWYRARGRAGFAGIRKQALLLPAFGVAHVPARRCEGGSLEGNCAGALPGQRSAHARTPQQRPWLGAAGTYRRRNTCAYCSCSRSDSGGTVGALSPAPRPCPAGMAGRSMLQRRQRVQHPAHHARPAPSSRHPRGARAAWRARWRTSQHARQGGWRTMPQESSPVRQAGGGAAEDKDVFA